MPTVFVVIYSTFVCPTEIIAFSDRIEEFRAINTEVVGCSVDSVFTHLAWYVNPLHPNISMHILHTTLYTFPRVLTRRICSTIKSFFSW